MKKISDAFKLLQETGNFEPSQLHEGNDRLWITPYGNCIDYQQLYSALAVAELLHLLPMVKKAEPFKLLLLDY